MTNHRKQADDLARAWNRKPGSSAAPVVEIPLTPLRVDVQRLPEIVAGRKPWNKRAAQADTRRMAETGTGSGRSPGGPVGGAADDAPDNTD